MPNSSAYRDRNPVEGKSKRAMGLAARAGPSEFSEERANERTKRKNLDSEKVLFGVSSILSSKI